MLGGNNGNPVLPIFLDENHLQYQNQANASNQLQLFGSLPVGCNVDPVNYFGNEHLTPMIRPNKRGRETEDVQRQKRLQISMNYNICKEEADCPANISNPNAVSTCLRLSYDDDERNSTVTSGSGSMTQGQSMIFSLGDNVRSELDRQKQEFDQYIKIQEQHLTKGIRDINQKHITSFLATIEKGISKKIREKDRELETVNNKNRELVERIKQVTAEAQNWQCRAKYKESVVNLMNSNLQQVISQGPQQLKEGFGDSEVDDNASYIDPNYFLGAAKGVSTTEHIICRVCKAKEVSILLMPCRHLCLCEDCDLSINLCPVCQVMKIAGVKVYLS